MRASSRRRLFDGRQGVKQPYFHFVSLNPGGAVPITDAYVIVDTSVLSTITAMAWRGFQPRDPQQQRAAHFLRWLRKHDVDLVSTSFAVVEGSGFHAGGVRDFDVQKRYLPFEALRVLSETKLAEFLDSGNGAITYFPTDDAERYLTALVEDVTELIPTVFAPAYLVALKLWLCRDAGMDMVTTSRSVMRLLADDLAFVPAVPWAVSLLRCFGRASVRRDLEQDLFKFDDPTHKRSPEQRAIRVRSAAWDLAYLEFLDHQRRQLAAAAPGSIKAGSMVLVTDDRGLARLGGLLSRSHPGHLAISPDDPDGPSGNRAVDEVRAAMRSSQRSAAAAAPDLAAVRELATRLESQLGVPSLSMTVRPEPASEPPDMSLMRGLLRALNGHEGTDLFDQLLLVRQTQAGDLLHVALSALRLLAEDNGRVRSRSGAETLQEVLGRLRERASRVGQLPTHGERLAAAWVRGDSFLANGLLREVEVVDPELYGPALVVVAVILQEVIFDTAAARGESPAEVFRRLDDRIGQYLAQDRPA